MSKFIVRNGVEYHDGHFIADKHISIIEGKLLTLADLLGLPDSQGEALKSEIRNLIWGRGILTYGNAISGEQIADFTEKLKETLARN